MTFLLRLVFAEHDNVPEAARNFSP